jgi:hypothetical protein
MREASGMGGAANKDSESLGMSSGAFLQDDVSERVLLAFLSESRIA